MKTTKGTIELQMFRADNVTAKCVWIGPIAIHKRPRENGKFSAKNYCISNITGFRILSLDGWLLRDIIPMVEECLTKIETENIVFDFKTWEQQARFSTVFTEMAVKHLSLKS